MPTKVFWTAARVALLGTASDYAIAKRLGVALQTVSAQRKKLGIARFGSPPGTKGRWGQTELGLLRSCDDTEFARITGRPLEEIAAKRREMQSR
jgi:hypothetical protein